VLEVEPQSPADLAGLQGTRVTGSGDVVPGDVIRRIDGVPVGAMTELLDLLEGYEVGDRVTLSLLRKGAPIDVELTLGGRYGALD
jgi:S1-C subfamily serine protease